MRRSTIPLLAMLLALLTAGWAPPSEWAPKEYPVSFWCGPPDPFITLDRYKQIAVAGFNYLMPPCEGASKPERNRRILDLAKAAGLKAFLQDDRMPLAISGQPDAKRMLDAIVGDYAKHPAFAGYFVFDEPGMHRFEGLGEVVAYLRQKDPAHPAYLNLYPDNADPKKDLVADSYNTYVRRFVRTVRPFAISYDHYHFLKTGDAPGFFSNIEFIRRVAIESDLPFWNIVLAVPHANYRPVNEAEKRWEAMQTLAFGGKGLLYFTYWTPTDKSFNWGPALVKPDGTLTPQYEEVRRINADVQAIGKYLVHSAPVTVFMNGMPTPESVAREPGTPVAIVGQAEMTVGLFRADTHLYVLFANRDYRKVTESDALLSSGASHVQKLDKRTGKWSDVKGESTADGDVKVKLSLAAGDGELYRW